MDTFEKKVFGRVTPHDERSIDRRTQIADAIYVARARAKRALRQNEQWCSDRDDGMKVCRVPTWEDFASGIGIAPPQKSRQCEDRSGVTVCRDTE